MSFRNRLLAGSSVRTIWARDRVEPMIAPAPARPEFQVGIGDVVDIGNGHEAVGFADESMPHGLRIEIREAAGGVVSV